MDHSQLDIQGLRKLVAGIEKAAGRPTTEIRQRWKRQQCIEYLSPAETAQNVEQSLFDLAADPEPAAVEIVSSEPEPLVVPKVSYEPIVTTAPKVSLGRRDRRDREKTSPTADEKLMTMWSKVTMEEMRHPAWHCLNKSEMLILMVCKIEASNAAYKKKKDSTGVPFFTFTHYNAKNFYDISSPTFSKSIKRLMEVGFIEISKSSGIFNGKGTKQEYRLSGKWKKYSPPVRRHVSNSGNLQKAREKWKAIQQSEKQNPI